MFNVKKKAIKFISGINYLPLECGTAIICIK